MASTDSHSAVTGGGDFDGDGRIDILARAHLPDPGPTEIRVYSGHCGSALQFGEGCAGAGDFTPSLDAPPTGDCAPRPNQAFTLTIDQGLGGQIALLLFGAGKASIPAATCTLNVAPLIGPILPLPLGGFGPGTGSTNLTAVVPPSAAGATLYLQAFLSDPTTPFGFSTTNGLELRVK